MAVTNLTEEMYQKEVMDTDKKVVIDFWADWCGPCKMMAPVVETVASENPDVKVFKVNVDQEPRLADAFSISSIPTIVVIKDREIIGSVVGYQPKTEIEKLLKLC
ncbi:MAG: thioredoxin [Ruminococcus sp.]|nr:thioredoxin [Ruminococcus sp.]